MSDKPLWGRIQVDDAQRDQLKQRPDVLEVPKATMYATACHEIFDQDYGFCRSIEENQGVDGQGQILPMYTYPAIEYLNQLNFSQSQVFEFGAGHSTLFWMKRCQKLVSMETDAGWHEKLKSQIDTNVELILDTTDDFPNRILDFQQDFDVIIIDAAGFRFDCGERALDKLKDGGLIILDNADWHHLTAERLRAADLLQVDMTGFKPLEPHTSTTSLFFHRNARFQSLRGRQPHYGVGAKHIHSAAWDKKYARQR